MLLWGQNCTKWLHYSVGNTESSKLLVTHIKTCRKKIPKTQQRPPTSPSDPGLLQSPLPAHFLALTLTNQTYKGQRAQKVRGVADVCFECALSL